MLFGLHVAEVRLIREPGWLAGFSSTRRMRGVSAADILRWETDSANVEKWRRILEVYGYRVSILKIEQTVARLVRKHRSRLNWLAAQLLKEEALYEAEIEKIFPASRCVNLETVEQVAATTAAGAGTDSAGARNQANDRRTPRPDTGCAHATE
jgi:hypothetical protein